MKNSFEKLANTPPQYTNNRKANALLRPMQPEDLPSIVQIHLSSFPDFFLTFLGPGFLKLLYRNIALGPEGTLFVAEIGDVIAGFVAGVTRQISIPKNVRG